MKLKKRAWNNSKQGESSHRQLNALKSSPRERSAKTKPKEKLNTGRTNLKRVSQLPLNPQTGVMIASFLLHDRFFVVGERLRKVGERRVRLGDRMPGVDDLTA